MEGLGGCKGRVSNLMVKQRDDFSHTKKRYKQDRPRLPAREAQPSRQGFNGFDGLPCGDRRKLLRVYTAFKSVKIRFASTSWSVLSV